MNTKTTGDDSASRAGQDLPPALPADVEAVLDAAREWWGERQISDWDEAALVKAIMTLDGDWPGCPECDHECDEPCMPFTVAEGHRSIDCRIAQLVFDGKLLAYTGYAPPEGWKPDKREQRRKAAREEWAARREARVEPVEGLSTSVQPSDEGNPAVLPSSPQSTQGDA